MACDLTQRNFAVAADTAYAELLHDPDPSLQDHDIRTVAMWLHGAYAAGRSSALAGPQSYNDVPQMDVRPLEEGRDVSVQGDTQ